jgi:hypothetical protein
VTEEATAVVPAAYPVPASAGIQRSLSLLVYGESKAGKSTIAATAPYPRLMLDVEGGARFLPIRAIMWDPLRDEPPVADGTWDTCVVSVQNYDTVLRAYQWLQLGRHQFRSLIIDSVSELQVKCIDNIAGTEQMKMQHWGELLRHFSSLLRNIRDLTMHPTNPLEAVVLTAMARTGQDGIMRPYLQGQLGVIVTYFWDVVGALAVEEWPNPDPMQPPSRTPGTLARSSRSPRVRTTWRSRTRSSSPLLRATRCG